MGGCRSAGSSRLRGEVGVEVLEGLAPALVHRGDARGEGGAFFRGGVDGFAVEGHQRAGADAGVWYEGDAGEDLEGPVLAEGGADDVAVFVAEGDGHHANKAQP